jgi:hypothetical protein
LGKKLVFLLVPEPLVYFESAFIELNTAWNLVMDNLDGYRYLEIWLVEGKKIVSLCKRSRRGPGTPIKNSLSFRDEEYISAFEG